MGATEYCDENEENCIAIYIKYWNWWRAFCIDGEIIKFNADSDQWECVLILVVALDSLCVEKEKP